MTSGQSSSVKSFQQRPVSPDGTLQSIRSFDGDDGHGRMLTGYALKGLLPGKFGDHAL